MYKTKVYISGAISKLKESVVEANFKRAEEYLKSCELEPVSPLNNGVAKGSHWRDHMKADIKMLMDCDVIYMQSGWQKSNGARIELQLAADLGMPMLFEDDEDDES